MTHAFGQGVSHALYALGWLGGVLTVAALGLLCLIGCAWLARSPVEVARIRLTARRLRREHAASGRT